MSEPKIFRIFAVVCIALVFVLLLAACSYGNQGEQETITFPKETERYYVILSDPLEDQIYTATDPSPVFDWDLYLGLANVFVIEIDYLHDGSYMQTEAIIDFTRYQLPEEMWEKIKSDAPVTDGKQEIRWRVKIDYVIHPADGPYYTSWGTFWIVSE